MRILSDVHTHTTFCDGNNTPEEMVKRAIELGYTSLGFSAHAYSPDGDEWCLPPEREIAYRDEINRLIYIYKEEIDISLGVEMDIFSKKLSFEPEYVIGSVHYVKCGDEYCSVDTSASIAEETVSRHFGGDWYAYADAYYDIAKHAAEVTNCDIVGHFDLVTKFNEGGRYFDENNIRYKTAAIDALRYEAEKCPLFEINTGAISRGYRSMPYPAPFLLKELNRLGGEVIITGDTHSVSGMGCSFDMAVEIARECGFKYVKILRSGKFDNIAI